MPIFKIARFEVRPEARDAVEQAMKEFAAHVAFELPGTSWRTYREPGESHHYISLIADDDEEAARRHRESPGTKKFVEALYPNVIGEVVFTEYEAVASSR
jgi:quinol monooxygenase YgiN